MSKKLFNEIKNKIPIDIWEKGKNIAESGKILHFSIETELSEKMETKIMSGLIEDFPNRMTEIFYTVDPDKLIKCTCTCRKNGIRTKFCKHVAALVYNYTDLKNKRKKDIMSDAQSREILLDSILNDSGTEYCSIVLEVKKDVCPVSKKTTLALKNIKIGNSDINYYNITSKILEFEENYKEKKIVLEKGKIYDPLKYNLTNSSIKFLSFIKEIQLFFPENTELFIKQNRVIIPYILIERFMSIIREMAVNMEEIFEKPEIVVDCNEKKEIKIQTDKLKDWESLGANFLIQKTSDEKINFLEIEETGVDVFNAVTSLSKSNEVYFGKLKRKNKNLINKLSRCYNIEESEMFLKAYSSIKFDELKPGISLDFTPDGSLIIKPQVFHNDNIETDFPFKYLNGELVNFLYKKLKAIPKCSLHKDKNNDIYFQITNSQAIYNFMTAYSNEIKRLFPVIYSKKVKKAKYLKTEISMDFSLDSLINFSFEAKGLSRKELAELLEKANEQNGDFITLKNLSIIEINREEVNELQKYIIGFSITKAEMSKDMITRGSYYKYFLGHKMDIENSINLDEYSNILNEYPTLREYQKAGIKWLLTIKKSNIGGILADDMGLGKTLQVLLFLRIYMSRNKESLNMIAVPKSLLENWIEEIEKFTPMLKIKVVSGDAVKRSDTIKKIEKGEIVITAYSYLIKDFAEYSMLNFDNLILDEAHYMKNHRTFVFRNIKNINSDSIFMLTGTPMENSIKEIWSLFDIIMPGYLGTLPKFLKIFKNAENIEILKSLVRPFILRRHKADVEKELPEKIEQTIKIEMENEQKIYYMEYIEKIKKDMSVISKSSRGKLTLHFLTRLRQLCTFPEVYFPDYQGSNAKIEFLENIVQNYIEEGHKILVFSQFASGLSYLQNKFSLKYKTALLNGKMHFAERKESIDEFKNKDAQIFFISVRVGGVGLNLTEADIVIHLDPWWNQSVENQATDRAHRIGQKKAVFVTNLMIKDSIEEHLYLLKKEKVQMIDSILESEYVDYSEINNEEFLKLIGIDIPS